MGYYSFVSSRDALLELMHESNQKMARLMAIHLDAGWDTRSDEELLASLSGMWREYGRTYPGSHLCVIDRGGIVHLDSVDPVMLGVDVSDMEIHLNRGGGRMTLGEVTAAGLDAAGLCSVAEDPSQIGAFAHSRRLDATIGVFVPGGAVERRVLTTALPWAAGMGFLGLVIMPVSFGLFFRASRAAQSQIRGANARLTAQMQEKELLLHEVYHRVKNNMQLVCSLLSHQAAHTDEAAAAGVLRESRDRVHSMALIHQELYQASDLARIRMGSYLGKLAGGLLQSYGVADRVTLQIDAHDLACGIETAIPLGLIVNELVSNSMKHAFPDDRAGQVYISLQAGEEGLHRLVVGDDGVGARGIELKRPGSLGLRIVSDLTRQLNGEIHVNHERGAEFQLTFSELESTT